MRFVVLIALAVILVGIGLYPTPGSDGSADAEASLPRGDANCSGVTDGRDALDTLLAITGIDVVLPQDCPTLGLQTVAGLGGDVNCDGEFDLLDPLTALMLSGGLPTGLVAAVDLQPSGLMFWDAVILTIDPAEDILPADQTAFVISEGEFVLHPLVLDSEEIQLPLTHFSAAGVAEGATTDLQPLSSAFDEYTAQAAALVLPQRAALLGGGSGDPDFSSELAGLMESYYDASLAPGLEISVASPAGLGACPVEITLVRLAWSFVAQGQSIGGQQQFPRLQSALQTLSPYLAGCRQADFERCVQLHDLGAISRIVAYTRVMEILGIPDSPSPLDEMIEKCARFEIDFESWFCVDDVTDFCDTGIEYLFKTASNGGIFSMPLTPTQVPLVSVQLERHTGEWGPFQGCQGTMNSPGSVFRVLSGGVSMNSLLSNGRPQVTLVINPGIPDETLELTCPWGTDIQKSTLWWQKWCSWHYLELTPPYLDTTALCYGNDEPGGWNFAIRGWSLRGDKEIIKEYRRDHDTIGVLEIGWELSQITLTHTPLP